MIQRISEIKILKKKSEFCEKISFCVNFEKNKIQELKGFLSWEFSEQNSETIVNCVNF